MIPAQEHVMSFKYFYDRDFEPAYTCTAQPGPIDPIDPLDPVDPINPVPPPAVKKGSEDVKKGSEDVKKGSEDKKKGSED